MAVELTAKEPWERTDGGSPNITSKQFDYLLLDGKHAAEFAGLKRLDDGPLLGSLLDIRGGTVFSSIREAITGLAKESAAYEKYLGFLKKFSDVRLLLQLPPRCSWSRGGLDGASYVSQCLTSSELVNDE